MKNLRLFLVVVISLLVSGNIFLLVQFGILNGELRQAKKELNVRQINEKTLTFAKLFVEKVLQGTDEVSFEDRLRLENSVRDINDPEIFDQWQNFIKTQTDREAQDQMSRLFMMLLNKLGSDTGLTQV